MKKVLIAIMAVVAVALAGIFFYLSRPNESENIQNTSGENAEVSTSESAETQGVYNEPFTGQLSKELKFTAGIFRPFEKRDDSNVGYIGYEKSKVLPEDMPNTIEAYEKAEFVKDYYKSFVEGWYNLVPVLDENGNPQKLYTGHTIYSDVDYQGQNGSIYYIINGFDVLNLNVYRNIPDDAGYLLRKENSSERIRLFNTQEELDKAVEAWNMGQEILADPEKEIPYGIILDGCLSDNAKWNVDEDGNVVVPLSTISTDFSDAAYVSMTGVLHIPFFEGCGSPSIEIPSQKAKNYDVEVYAFDINTENGTWHYSARQDGGLWEAELPLASNTFSMDIASASQLTGWDFSFDGTMLNIVTDPCNVTNNFILRQ